MMRHDAVKAHGRAVQKLEIEEKRRYGNPLEAWEWQKNL